MSHPSMIVISNSMRGDSCKFDENSLRRTLDLHLELICSRAHVATSCRSSTAERKVDKSGQRIQPPCLVTHLDVGQASL